MFRTKSILTSILVLCLVFALLGCSSPATPSGSNSAPSNTTTPNNDTAPSDTATPSNNPGNSTIMLKIGTGSPGGLWYPSSAILAAALETALAEAGMQATCSIQSTANAFNINAVNDGVDMQIALATSQNQYLAYNGMAPFEAPLTNLRLIGTQELMLTQIVVPASSSIQSVYDLKDKVVNGGKIGSIDEIMIKAMLNAYDLSFDSIKANGGNIMSLGWDDAAAMMQDGHMDCISTFGGLMPSIVNLIVQPGVRFLSLDDEHIDKILADPTMPGFLKATLQPGTYDGQDYAVNTIAVPTTILCNADLSEDLVYLITKAIYESGYYTSPYASTAAKGWPKICNPEDLPKVANIPVHPGTIKYFKEIGIDIPGQ